MYLTFYFCSLVLYKLTVFLKEMNVHTLSWSSKLAYNYIASTYNSYCANDSGVDGDLFDSVTSCEYTLQEHDVKIIFDQIAHAISVRRHKKKLDHIRLTHVKLLSSCMNRA